MPIKTCRNTLVGFAAALVCGLAWAGSPHFVGAVDIFRQGNSLFVSGKVAGLGSETQVEVIVTATAVCINPGQNRPKAANKQSVSDQNTFPVQNGKAEFDLTLTAAFQPDCSPPMTVQFQGVTVTGTTVSSGSFSTTVPGTF
jgi:hypothetical protein